MENWISPRIIIGNTAIGDYYYNRPGIVAEIWEEIEKGNHVLLAAPRRIGKSSVMIFMSEHCAEGIKAKFENIEGITSEEGFYKRIYELMQECLSRFQKAEKWLGEDVKISVKKVSTTGVEFGETKTVYLDEIRKILLQLQKNKVKIVLFIDELPEVLKFLYKNNKKEQASSILNNIRAWRQNEWKSNFALVLAGSVGIHHVVKTYEGRTADLNDLHSVKFEAFTNAETKDYIVWVTKNASVQYSEELQNYIITKITYSLPYFINLLLNEINIIAKKASNVEVNRAIIDKAFDAVIKNSDYFEEWRNRLFEYFPKEEADFLDEVLTNLAKKGSTNLRQVHDLAIKHQQQKKFVSLLDDLEKDGYIVEQNEKYVFVSPFLQAFWKRSNPFYDAN